MVSLIGNAIAANLVWSGALAVAVALAGRARLVRQRPALIHVLWLFVLIKLVTPPLIPVGILPVATIAPTTQPHDALASHKISLREPSGASQISGGAVDRVADSSKFSSTRSASENSTLWWDWRICLMAFSLSVTGVVVVRGIRQMIPVSQILRRAGQSDHRMDSIARKVAAQLGVESPRISVVDIRLTPLLWVQRNRPLVVLPRILVEKLSDDRLQCIIGHELRAFPPPRSLGQRFQLLDCGALLVVSGGLVGTPTDARIKISAATQWQSAFGQPPGGRMPKLCWRRSIFFRPKIVDCRR